MWRFSDRLFHELRCVEETQKFQGINSNTPFSIYFVFRGQTVYLERNIDPRSCNHCRSEKVRSFTYSGCVFVALGIQHSMRLWGLG